ncbi:heptaprenyl diphosphate synthase component 1 [Niallia sp. XMNu-256]|uniref:heptaprenyl diphosphate synthase component 1 n=1 Tax=Niallia sp. XMNu-256 TaxID=3082444 RepID=UPI0030D5D6B4
MSDIEIRIAQMKEIIERYVLHPYLRKYIQLPKIDEDKLLILISIADQLDLSPIEQDSYIIAIMLMYIALDTHDYVSNSLKDDNSMKTRQLTILAGDYYSGLYYKFLAKVENIAIIKKLSKAVKRINEHKVTLYSKNQNNVREVMDSVKVIEFSLIEEFAHFFNITNWDYSIANFLLLNRLIEEKELFLTTGNSVVLHAIDRSTFASDRERLNNHMQQSLIQQCESFIEHAKKQIMIGMDDAPLLSPNLKQRLMDRTQPVEKSFVEEG